MTGNKNKTFVAVVSTSRHYGGPEEGGWWYDWSNTEKSWSFDNPRRARRFARRLEREESRYMPRHNRFSVLGGTDLEICRTRDRETLDSWQSRTRPTYC